MNLERLRDRFVSGAKATRADIEALRAIVKGDDPFDGITLVADWRICDLIPDVVDRLGDADPMVRWNAVSTAFVRLRDTEHLEGCLERAVSDADAMVRGAALAGLGEALPFAERGSEISVACARTLVDTLESEEAPREFAGDAYEGILASLEVPHPSDRP